MSDQAFESTGGTVYLLPDKVRIMKNDAAGVLANHLSAAPRRKRVLFYALAAAAAIATALIATLRGDYGLAVVVALFGAWMIHGLLTSNTPEGASIIMRDTIEGVEVHPPSADGQPGYFIIHYRESGIERLRKVVLPPDVTERSVEYARAAAMIRALEEERFLADENQQG